MTGQSIAVDGGFTQIEVLFTRDTMSEIQDLDEPIAGAAQVLVDIVLWHLRFRYACMARA